MTENPVFVCSCFWRSGSTLLQRVINSTNEITIWGENLNIIRDLWMMEDKMMSQNRFGNKQRSGFLKGDKNAWTANMNPNHGAILKAERLFLDSLYGPGRWGMKEVRLDKDDLDHLIKLYPKGKFVFIHRDFEACFTSLEKLGWTERIVTIYDRRYAGNDDIKMALKSRYDLQRERQLSFINQYPNDCFFMNYEEVTEEKCQELLSFCCLSESSHIREVLALKIGT